MLSTGVSAKAITKEDLYLNPQIRNQMFLEVRQEMLRLDGEGLIARKGRPKDFIKTTDDILKEYSTVTSSKKDFFTLFRRMDGAYTNLHSNFLPK